MLITKPNPSMTFWTSFAQICGASRVPYMAFLEQAYKICRTVLGILAGKLDVDTAAINTVEKSTLHVHDHNAPLPLVCMYDGHLRRHQRRCAGEEFVDPLPVPYLLGDQLAPDVGLSCPSFVRTDPLDLPKEPSGSFKASDLLTQE